MSETMTINRIIHDAVRRDLDRLDDALGRFPDGDQERARELQRGFANLRRELTHHHEQEDDLIWPMLGGFGVDADLLAIMESEHKDMATALADTDTAMTKLALTGSGADAAAAQESVRRTREVTNRHLSHEEDDIEPLLIARMDSPEWKAVEKKLRKEPPTVAGRWFAWVQDGMSPEGRTYLNSEVPRPVTFLLGRVFGRSYHREIAPIWQS